MHEARKKSAILIFTSLRSDITAVVKYKVDANDDTHMTEQMTRNLTMHLIKISVLLGAGHK